MPRARPPLTERLNLTFDVQQRILVGLLISILLFSQARKLAGSTSRNGSFLDNLQTRGGFLDGAMAFGVFAVVSIALHRRRRAIKPTATDGGNSPPLLEKLTTLPSSKICEAAAVTAAAFAAPERSNVWTAICGQGASLEDRHSLLRFIFERNFYLRVGSPCCRALFGRDGRLVCCFMFVTPDVAGVSPLDMVRAGLLRMPLRFGLGATRRLLAEKSRSEAGLRAVRAAHGLEHTPICMLERMVVHPAAQGRGIGTRALRPCLDEADAAGWPTLLSTNEERNVVFYRRLGFEVVLEETVELEGVSIQTWHMLRHAPGEGKKSK